MAETCNKANGCAPVRVLDVRVTDVERDQQQQLDDIAAIHRRIDTILITVLTTLGAAVVTLIVTLVRQ